MRRITRHIKEGTSGVKRNGAMSLSSAAAVTLTLLIVSLFIILTANLNSVSDNISNSLLIHVKVDNAVSSKEDIDKLNEQIKAINGIRTVTFSDRDEQLQKQIEAFPSLKQAFEIREENPLRNAFIVTVTDRSRIESISESISKLTGIENVEFGGDGIVKLVEVLSAIQTGGLVLVIFLGILAVFLISNTIRVTIYARKEEIGIMRTVGASNGFIRAPFLVEGMLIGLFGSLIPIIISVVTYYMFFTSFRGVFFTSLFKLVNVFPFLLYLALLLAFIGIIVGFIGSFISVTRFLRWKR